MIRLSNSYGQLQKGLTLVELLVVLGLLFILSAITLPAIGSARGTYQQLACSQKLRQLGLGLAAYESTHGQYPAVIPNSYDRRFSPGARLLPYLDENDIYNRINFSISAIEPSQPYDERVGGFLCPAQSLAGFNHAGNSYRYNSGIEGTLHGGPFLRVPKRTPADVLDGLSRTAFMSERVLGSRQTTGFDPSQDVFASELITAALWYPDYAVSLSIKACSRWQPMPTQIDRLGALTWILPELVSSRYVHNFPPNSAVPDCVAVTSPDRTTLYYGHDTGVISARSWHPGGVNVLFGDGSVRFVINSVDHLVWLAAATIAGGEAVPMLD